MPIPTKEPLLMDAEPEQPKALQRAEPVSDVTGLALVVERLAANPDVDVTKLEKVIELQLRIMRHVAKTAFDAAFAEMQPEIPIIDERGRIEVKGTLRSTYAPLEDIHEVIKPICAKFGFAVRHRTEWPEERKGIIRIVGILSHRQGHSEESIFEAPMDKSDYRTDIQSMGSTVSYGRRYSTMDLLNIATKKLDNDGQRREQPAPDAPKGYEDWLTDMEATADDGLPALEAAWKASRADYRAYTAKHNAAKWAALKAKAGRVVKGA